MREPNDERHAAGKAGGCCHGASCSMASVHRIRERDGFLLTHCDRVVPTHCTSSAAHAGVLRDPQYHSIYPALRSRVFVVLRSARAREVSKKSPTLTRASLLSLIETR